MKALILAAGFGTRLLPFTRKIPKPLFTIQSKTVLEHVIQQLVDAGCEQIVINTHHLHDQIAFFVDQLKYPVDIQTLYEPVILDTGGAIANAKPFLNDSPFFVINSDIISSVDLNAVYAYHNRSNMLATLVLHDYPDFNKVILDNQGLIQRFDSTENGLAFTGIQVLSPGIYDYFPDKKIFSSIAVYQDLCRQKKINAFVVKNFFWSDIGTKESYSLTSALTLCAARFNIPLNRISHIQMDQLAGDGSDRYWYRAAYGGRSVIVSDHGICLPKSERRSQLNAFIHIGNHLLSKKIFVPCILDHDLLSGMVVLEDLGDVHLETLIKQKKNDGFTLEQYKQVIDCLIDFSAKGFEGFKKEWTCQTHTYSKELIIEKECLYFMTQFIQGHLNQQVCVDEFLTEFDHIANHALKNQITGLMHRDMQSRNIMITHHQPFFIDFQSARIGPLQYDLASLLIDPYVLLNHQIKNDLVVYTMEKLNLTPGQRHLFLESYHYCCLTRNLQILGAFSFLSRVKQKKQFEIYIPDAVRSLKGIVYNLNTDKLPRLSRLVQNISRKKEK